MRKKRILTLTTAIVFTICMFTIPFEYGFLNSFGDSSVIVEAAYVPPAPTIKKVGTKAEISWNKIDNATRYVVYISEQGSAYSQLADVDENILSVMTDELIDGKSYCVRMCAYINDNGNKHWTSHSDMALFTLNTDTSEPAFVKVSESSNNKVVVAKHPAAKAVSVPTVSKIDSIETSACSARFMWTRVAGATGYAIEIWTGTGWLQAGETANNVSSFEFNYFLPNWIYSARMRCYIKDSNGNKTYGAYSDIYVFFTKPYFIIPVVTTKASVGSVEKGVTGGTYNEGKAYDVAAMINLERTQNGKNGLLWDETLYACAKVRAQEIAVQYSHTRPNGDICGTVSTIYKGENIVYGYNSAIGAHNAWMGSQGHKDNILRDKFHTVAVACYEYNGTCYWVTAFGY